MPIKSQYFAFIFSVCQEQDASDAPIPVAASESKADNNAIKPGAEKIVESNLKPDTNQEGNTIDENSQVSFIQFLVPSLGMSGGTGFDWEVLGPNSGNACKMVYTEIYIILQTRWKL